jgi:hypothetical protein
MKLSRLLSMGAVIAVLAAYAYFGSSGRWSFPLISWRQSYYASQAEGFLRGRLSMAHEPPPVLAQLPDPYSHEARRLAGVRSLWDASYFEGRYYLYFSPVPALLFDIPVRVVFGAYPPDPLITTFCASVAFLLFVLALRRTVRRESLFFWILLLGVGNIIPYVLIRTAVYQVPIACAMMFTAGFAYALVRFLEAPSMRIAFAMGLCLALAIASRQNLGVLVIVAAVIVIRFTPRNELARMVIACAAPLVVIGSMVLLFNYARFHSPLESGICYQLAGEREEDCAHCAVRNWPEVMRLANGFLHFTFWTPRVHGRFPYLEVQTARLDPEVTYKGRPEPVAGIIPITPLVVVGTGFAILLALRRDPLGAAERSGVAFIAGGWIVLLGLASCRWVTARFALDYTPLLIAGTAVCTEAGFNQLAEWGVSVKPLRIGCVVVGSLSIAAGLLLPFSRMPWY